VREPDVDTDPERALLLADSQEAVRQANAKLAPRHREVLALREVAGRSYEEIGAIMGISENAAAQLIWRARSKLKVAMTAGAVASVVAASEDCETAQLLLNRLQDGEPITDEDQLWLDEHLDECGKCRAARGMLFEVGTSYRAWAPVAVIAALRPEVLTQAGHTVGADWSGVAGKAATSHGAVIGTASVAIVAATGLAIAGLLHDNVPVTREAAPTPAAPTVSKPKPSPAPKASKPKPAVAKAASVHRAAKSSGSSPKENVVAALPEPAPKNAAPPTGAPPPTHKPAPRVERPKPKPPAKPEPAPVTVPPEVGAPPTPPAVGDAVCTFPGKGKGPAGCPPGHGGIPPGQGGTPPGQFGRSH
jgi:predicted DNA-binding protein (UPF0251 family)